MSGSNDFALMMTCHMWSESNVRWPIVGNHNHNNDDDDGWLVGYLVTSTLLIDYVFDIYNQWSSIELIGQFQLMSAMHHRSIKFQLDNKEEEGKKLQREIASAYRHFS
ncbi:hypothetical protein DERF_014796 [Dermatophagoides farinae]|uniref:Uncharacterized protein n=1 Tax=Dermatophagoides farinae TaxID=6954 RepID=A0A922HK57_DERFA|nr:hypothetical protein DERF_014796 [Dermatophagoides farinae]